MELNAETIKKALECCYDNDKSCLTCPFQSAYTPCVNLNKNALALIKELTSALTKKETEYNELYELTEDLRNENERLKADNEIKSQKRANIFEIANAFERGRTDGVRKMSEMLKDYLDDYYHSGEDALLDVPDMIDLIAKEILEGENES